MRKQELESIPTIGDLDLLKNQLLAEIKALVLNRVYPQKTFYSPKEFSAQTGIPYSTVIYKCKMGKIQARQDDPNCGWQISADEIERFKKEASENI